MPKYVNAYGFILLRVVGATLLFWLLSSFLPKEKIEKQDFKRLIACGFFGAAINMMMFFKGLSYTTPINASIIMTSIPIMVLLMASIIIKEKISGQKTLGILLGATGAIVLIVSDKSLSIGTDTLWGDSLTLFNAMSYGLYLVMVKPLMNKYEAFTVIKWVFLFGTLFVMPLGIPEVLEVNWNNLPTDIWYGIAYVVIGTTFLSYLFNSFGIKFVGPSIVAMYIYLQPILASAFALYLGKDILTPTKVICTALIFVGVYLVSRPVKKTAFNS
jgi:drug/metabolite transporter (DMT)-like permease